MRGHGGNVKKTGKRAAALLLSWVMALGGGSMPVMAEMVPGRETVREETEAGQAESPESGQTGPQGQETVQPGAAPEESTGGPQIAAPSAPEPLIEYGMINSLIETFKENKDLKMATLKHKLLDKEEIENPNNVKVVCDKNDYAIYFSRSVIPYPRKNENIAYFKHIGIYGYKRDFVIEYSKMPITPLEETESLEQLRVLENGYKIKVLETTHSLIGVDTQENLEQVITFIRKNNIKI